MQVFCRVFRQKVTFFSGFLGSTLSRRSPFSEQLALIFHVSEEIIDQPGAMPRGAPGFLGQMVIMGEPVIAAGAGREGGHAPLDQGADLLGTMLAQIELDDREGLSVHDGLLSLPSSRRAA